MLEFYQAVKAVDPNCRNLAAMVLEGSGVYSIGGTDVFCEVLGREKKLVICGAGHVSLPIIQMGQMIGCLVYVLEDRPLFADRARRAGASQVICEPFEQGLKKIKGDPDTFFIIVTRGHRYDQICLESIIKKEHAYIGMIGSRKRSAKKECQGEGNRDRPWGESGNCQQRVYAHSRQTHSCVCRANRERESCRDWLLML